MWWVPFFFPQPPLSPPSREDLLAVFFSGENGKLIFIATLDTSAVFPLTHSYSLFALDLIDEEGLRNHFDRAVGVTVSETKAWLALMYKRSSRQS